MGTNYYFMTTNKALVHKFFEDDYEIVDDPFLGYRIHICKLSGGWRPLFQEHKNAISSNSFKELKELYLSHSSLRIFDEYNEELAWKDFEEAVLLQSQIKERYWKWVYDFDDFSLCTPCPKKTVHLVPATESDYDVKSPFVHREYDNSYKKVCEKLNAPTYCDFYLDYSEDPEYDIDWVNGEFC